MSSKHSLNEYPRVGNFFTLVFCGYVLTWYLQIGSRIGVLGAIRFEFIYGVILTGLAVILIVGQSGVLNNPLSTYVMLYFINLVIQIPFSASIDLSMNIFIDRVVKFSMMAFFIVVFVKSPTHLKFFLAAFLLACMKMGQEGLWGRITGGLIWENQGVMRLHGATGMYTHPNSFAGMALGTIPFIINLTPIASWFIRIPLIIQMLFALNIILYTGSRTGYVAFFVIIIYYLYISKMKMKLITYLLLASIITIPMIPGKYIDRINTIFTQEDIQGHSIEHRKDILKDAILIFLDYPFGVGLGAFPVVRQQTFGRAQDTHNLYLEVATNLGIQGIIIFFLLIYKLLKTLSFLKKSFSEQIERLKEEVSNNTITNDIRSHINLHLKDLNLLAATCSAVYLFVIIRLALGVFGMDLYEIYWWFAIGMTIALFNMNKVAEPKTKELLILQ